MRERRKSLAICALLLLAGCGKSAGAAPPKHVVHRLVVTPTAGALGYADSGPTAAPGTTSTPAATSESGPTATATVTVPAPTDTPVPAILPPRLIYAQLRPDTVAPGATLSGSVQTGGTVSRVVMYLGSAPGGPAPQSYDLSQAGTGNWTTAFTAPTVAGTYHFTVGLFSHSGRRIVIDNDGWNVTVGSQQAQQQVPTAAAAQPLPGDIPLSPPFNYGDPQPAVFSAAGRTVTGSEVTSNSRPDVSASLVAQFYSVHLPRAGWMVDSGSVPGPGAAAFSIVGTQSGRVVVVQFAAGTLHIFYGSLTG